MELESKGLNYKPKSISFAEGFLGPKGYVGFQMVADEERAKKVIDKLNSDVRIVKSAELGLDGDFIENSSIIYKNGKFHPYTAWRSSQWAEPILLVKFNDGSSEDFLCWNKE